MTSLDEISDWNDDPIHSLINDDLKELLKFASCESLFTFDDKYYCPWDGFVIGFPLEPTLAYAFLCHFEKQWLYDWPTARFLP